MSKAPESVSTSETASDDGSDRRRGVQSIDRAVRILQTFGIETPERGVSEIARLLNLTPSTTHRLLSSLQDHGIVRQVAGGSRYALGPALLRMANVAHKTIKLAEVARPVMVELRDSAEETVGLHVADDTPARLVIEQVESRQALRRTYTELGRPVPIHEGAPGKFLLAHLPDALREAVLAGPIRKSTPNTIVDPDVLREVLVGVRAAGYATSVEERVPGISTVAVGVRDFSGEVVAALSVSGPTSRMSKRRLKELVPVAKSAAVKLSSQLGYLADATTDVASGDS